MNTSTKTQASLGATQKIVSALYQWEIDLQGTSRARFSSKKWLGKFRRLLLRWGDPVVEVRMGTRKMLMPLSHRAPALRAQDDFYDKVIARLVAFACEQDDRTTVIDVGANIGDTVQLILDAGARKVIAIEGDGRYFLYLEKNWGNDARVDCLKAMLADQSMLPVSTVEYAGTAYPSFAKVSGGFSEVADSDSITLDNLVSSQEVDRIDILKTDTDGFDLRVLRGSTGILERFKPALFLEYSPEHYEKVGRIEPLETFNFLAQQGYETVLIYDSAGYPMLSGATGNIDLWSQLTRYASIKGLYYDILTFHKSQQVRFEMFSKRELCVFPKFNRHYLPSYPREFQ